MIWRRKPPRRVRVQARAINMARELASEAFPAETGGILVGWRTEEAVHVFRMPQVPDYRATASSYQRNHDVAEAVLQEELNAPVFGGILGYVGEWHSHPAPLASSIQDHREMISIGRLAGGAVAMLVLIRDTEGAWSIEATTALSRKVAPAAVEVEEDSR